LLADNPCDTLENVLFWQVSFPKSPSPVLEEQVEQVERASERLKQLKTLMFYCCRFPNETARQALLAFTNQFA